MIILNRAHPLVRVAVSVPTAHSEIARAWLVVRFPEGFEERESAGTTELAVYTDETGTAEILGAFAEVRTEPVESGWEHRWKEFHRPVRAGGLWIGPPWLAESSAVGAVVVDPGRAFGTGAHATTRACIELLAGLERKCGSLLDAGCGSGVVAVAAVRLGFAPVHAVDVDPVAVAVAVETARRNAATVDVRRLDVLRDELPDTDVVVANIQLSAVEALLARVSVPTVITSGYLAGESPRAEPWTRVRRLELDGWAADVLVAK